MARPITLRLEQGDDERLRAEAARLGVKPGTLARIYVRAGLAGDESKDTGKQRATSDALGRLGALRAQVRGEIDAVEVVGKVRAELARRSSR